MGDGHRPQTHGKDDLSIDRVVVFGPSARICMAGMSDSGRESNGYADQCYVLGGILPPCSVRAFVFTAGQKLCRGYW
jgi:hypothetical protein